MKRPDRVAGSFADSLSRRHFFAAAMLAAAASPTRRAVAIHGAANAVSMPASLLPSLQQSRDHDEKPGDRITRETIAQAEKLACLTFSDDERDQILRTIDTMLERQRMRRSIDLPYGLAPSCTFSPLLPGVMIPDDEEVCTVATQADMPIPETENDIAFASVTQLSRWLHSGAITSVRLTELYIERLKRYDEQLRCVVTLTEDLSREQAERADAELLAGESRGPLHGIPWGAKDLFDTAGLPTTWGAAVYRDRVAESDAFVVQKLASAGAVLVAKLSLGALAYGDIWFGGRTNNPWNIEEGSSGSSAGSACAVAAGLVGFALGTETYGSIVSPCMACGTTGLRPTFGRVARTGAMPLCWSLDKIGPICRTVEDCALVFAAIHGSDAGDPSSFTVPFSYRGDATLRPLHIGYNPAWFESEPAVDLDRDVLERLREAGHRLVEVSLPDWPYSVLESILLAEAASAFDDLTMSNADDQLAWQDDEAWPNTFRQTRLMPAVELVQADRFRRRVCEMMQDVCAAADVLIAPSFAANLLLITNFTGHPSLTLRTGFSATEMPHGITLIGPLFSEPTLCRLGHQLEQQLNVWDRRPLLE